MEKLSAILITKDEEDNIKDCLESVKWADEIVLVDQSSTDKTVEITKRYTDKIYVVESKGICEPDRPFAVSKASYDWVLYVDADERISSSLRDEIAALLKSSDEKKDAYFIPRKTFFLGRWIKGCGWYPSYVIRLFKKGKVFFPAQIFKDGETQADCGYLKEHILHYSYKNIEEYFRKANRYTMLLAETEYKKGLRINLINFLFLFVIKPIYWFFKKYFFLKGFMDGIYGFFISYFTAAGIIITYAKVWELQKKLKNKSV